VKTEVIVTDWCGNRRSVTCQGNKKTGHSLENALRNAYPPGKGFASASRQENPHGVYNTVKTGKYRTQRTGALSSGKDLARRVTIITILTGLEED